VTLYDRIGVGYAQHRRPDPRWAAIIHRALGDAKSVVNVGAGAGSYEPADRFVVGLEPSLQMISQRAAGTAPVVRGIAEALPFRDRAFDATLAVLTVHHWPNPGRGLAEMRRVAGRQIIVTWQAPVFAERFWLLQDYLPQEPAELFDAKRTASALSDVTTIALPVPHDCTDGVFGAYWRRPEAYLDPAVRASISGLALADPQLVAQAMARLEADLRSGAWERKHGDLLDLDELDLGYCVLIGENNGR